MHHTFRGVALLVASFAVAVVSFSSTTVEAAETANAKSEDAAATEAPVPDAAALEFVATKVQPVLEARCYECHGPEADEAAGGLRLDSRAAALHGGETGPAIKVGNSADSLLIESIEYRGEYDMPPDSKMPEGEVAILAKWIEMGAPWPEEGSEPIKLAHREPFPLEERLERHWVWRDIKKVDPPAVHQHNKFARTAIDQFVAASLENNGMAPAAAADRRTLLRRAWFDLVGLPPSKEAIAAFVNDPAPTPQAFEKVVDELLASPRFGERWGRHWLDLVRYAETSGHEYDYTIHNAHRYRDYVIRALNLDVPYDQFLTEHVAGDLMPSPRRHVTDGYNESIIGTGFWYFFEGQHAPVDARGDEQRIFANQIDVFSKTFLGLTVACARCHDHKFDAISQADYYSLAGYLKSSRRQQALLDPHGKIAEKRSELLAQRDVAQLAFDAAFAERVAPTATAFAAGLSSDSEKWKTALADEALDQPSHPLYTWKKLAAASADDFDKQREGLQKELRELAEQAVDLGEKNPLIESFADPNSTDGWFVTGKAFENGPTKSGQWDRSSEEPAAIRPGIIHSGTISNKLQGVMRSPTFTIEKKQLLYKIAGKNAKVRVIIDGYTLDTANPLLFRGALFEVNTGGKFVWKRQAQDVSNYVGHRAHLEFIDHGDGYIAVEEIRFSDATAPPPPKPNPVGRQAVEDPRSATLSGLATSYGDLWQQARSKWLAGTATEAEHNLVAWALRHRLIDTDYDALQAKLAKSSEQMQKLDAAVPWPMRVLAKTDGTPEEEFVLIRGNHRTPGDPTPRRLLEAIEDADGSAATSGSRLELAQRMVEPSNPLTSRVMVNRIWHHLFGRGIVPSVDNLGELGQAPTHPELLDYLAVRFVEEGWSVKRAIREVMLSSTYQMSSKPTDAEAEEADPTNALLHRQRVRRLQGEAIRDAMLSVSGRLDTKMYGRGVPIHLTSFMEGRGRPDKSGPLDGAGRRSVYVEVRRNFLSPMLVAFDTPIPFGTVGRRNISNVPAQPLILMNDPFVYQQATEWAKQSLQHVKLSPRQRVEELYESSFGRQPTDKEAAAALAFAKMQAEQIGVEGDDWQSEPRVWADLCHVIWNVKEFIFIH